MGYPEISLAEERIVWIDVETTGLDANTEHLLQVACIITDGNLQELNEGFEAKVYYSSDEVEKMKRSCIPFVKEMHEKTGLWDLIPTEGIPMQELSDSLLDELKRHTSAGKSRLGGNSITLDRNFINKNIPDVGNFLSYRSYDMSSVSGWFELYAPEVPLFVKENNHEALDDIRASIAEGKYFMEALRKMTPPF